MNSDKHSLSLSMAIIIGVNSIVGASIFLAPAALQVIAGPAALMTYGLVSIAALCMGLALARVAQLYPEKGVFYSYAKIWGGHTWGVIAMGSYTTGLVIALGLLARVTGSYLSLYIPCINPLYLSLGLIALVVAANLAGAKIAKTGQIILMVLTYIPLIIIMVLCFLKTDLNNLIPFVPYGWMSIFKAIPVVIFGFFGFEAIPSLCTEIENPEKNVPKALTWTIIAVGITYITFASSIFVGIPRILFTDASTSLATVLVALYPHATWLVNLIEWAIIITITGTLHAMIWSLGTLTVNTSDFIYHNTKKISQQTALLAIGSAVAGCCILFKNIGLMFDLTALGIVIAYATAMIPLLTERKGRSAYQIMIASLGLLTAILIFMCGLTGVFNKI